MKKVYVLLMVLQMTAAMFPAAAFAWDDENVTDDAVQKKHQQFDNYFGVSIGTAGMKTDNHGILTADAGVAYGFYLFDWMSINTGLLFHTEFYSDNNLLTENKPMVYPLCFTIPFGIHVNIPNLEWLYTGVNIAINIPIADLGGEKNDFAKNNVFVSLPLDLGFDFIKPGGGGSRALLRVTPVFHNGGTVVPVGFVWQIYNWKIFAKKVEVNIPPPPTVIIGNL